MNYKLLGKSGLRASEFALGTMTFGTDWGWGSAEDEAQKVYNALLLQMEETPGQANQAGPSILLRGFPVRMLIPEH